jgi:MFS family permease
VTVLDGSVRWPDHRLRTVQRRTVWTLVCSQALGGLGMTIGIAVAALLGEEISGSEKLAGLAQTMQVLGAAVASFALAHVMGRSGRRIGLSLGYLAGATGSALCVVAAVVDSFLLLMVATTLLGATTAANNQSRYAATDLADPLNRARALSLVVWATTVGSVLGPNLAGPGDDRAGRWGCPPSAARSPCRRQYSAWCASPSWRCCAPTPCCSPGGGAPGERVSGAAGRPGWRCAPSGPRPPAGWG